MTPSQLARTQNASQRQRPARERYSIDTCRRAIARACDQAFGAPLRPAKGETKAEFVARLTQKQKQEWAEWRTAHRWHPHQLRHSAATNLRKDYGIEAAQLVLGHRSAAVTEIYAELDAAKATAIMEAVR